MRNTLIMILAIILLVICLLSGGCSKPDQGTISEWQELLKFPEAKDQSEPKASKDISKEIESQSNAAGETLQVSLYFADACGQKLVREDRNIAKVEGIARETMEELIKGPANVESAEVFPAGTRLLDINLKPDGLCIVNLTSEARHVADRSQEKLMIDAIAKTLGQFPTVQEISFMINGENVDSIGGYVDLSAPIRPDFSS
jgi:spore germination protein GerM